MQPASAWGDDLMITHKTWVEGPVRVFNFSVEHTPSYFAGQDSLWVHNANGGCDIDPRNPFNYPIDAEIPWPDAKPKGPDWNPVPVDKDNVTKVTRVAEGLRLEMKPSESVKARLGLSDDDRISLVYDERGNPDFNSLKKADGTPIDVTPNNGKVEIEYAPLDPNLGTEASKNKARREDYRRANEKLINENRELAVDLGVVKKDGTAKKSEPTKKGGDGKQLYAWHHSPDGKGMELVDFTIHEQFKHSGGRSNFDNGN